MQKYTNLFLHKAGVFLIGTSFGVLTSCKPLLRAIGRDISICLSIVIMGLVMVFVTRHSNREVHPAIDIALFFLATIITRLISIGLHHPSNMRADYPTISMVVFLCCYILSLTFYMHSKQKSDVHKN